MLWWEIVPIFCWVVVFVVASIGFVTNVYQLLKR